MKKIIAILAFMITTVCFSQKVMYPVKVGVLHPMNKKTLFELTEPDERLFAKLDSLSKVYKSDRFIIRAYYEDGKTIDNVIENKPVVLEPVKKQHNF